MSTNLTLQVLISCMRQTDYSIINRTNIQSDVIVVNQCDTDTHNELSFEVNTGEKRHAFFISTTERGLSRSRNMAIRNSTVDICLICDDDEILDDDYPQKIQRAFRDNPSADVIAFQIQNAGKVYPKTLKKIGYLRALKLASWQLAFRRAKIVERDILFDETLGSGVSKAGGEENMFVYDCLKKGLNVIFVPITIGCMIESDSQWFYGFTQEYFYDRGVMTRKLMGRFFATLYALYFLISKYSLYRNDVSMLKAFENLYKAIFQKS